jgi:hypothetical protein
MESRFLKDALFAGCTSNAFKLGTALCLSWFWSRIAGCSLLYRGTSMEQIDFLNILATEKLSADTITPPTYLPHNSNSTYFYVVRRVNGCGYEEQTLSAAVKVSINGDGELARQQPNKIFTCRVALVDGNKIKLIWYYCPIEQKSKPVQFKVYSDAGTGQIEYDNPIATISYGGRIFYSYLSDILQGGRYLFAINAEDAEGVEDSSLAQLRVQLQSASPDAIGILSVEAI